MSPSESRNGHETDSVPEGGILAALPRARPQRASTRRAAARANKPATKTVTTTKAKSAPAATTVKPNASKKAVPVQRPVAGKKPIQAHQRVTGKKAVPAQRPIAGKKAVSTTRRAAKPVAKLAVPPVPRQGYEPEEELELGKTVNPPSGAELVESVADIIGEVANSGLTAGGRLLKDALSLLRRP
ncbi:MAG TPA: hypothetical protein VGP18_04625 [Solirubrobacteraceae bacterium]|jgi:hypothetical protein|nr:hypothetical protein [Solirubrobacteraceae bacterium]